MLLSEQFYRRRLRWVCCEDNLETLPPQTIEAERKWCEQRNTGWNVILENMERERYAVHGEKIVGKSKRRLWFVLSEKGKLTHRSGCAASLRALPSIPLGPGIVAQQGLLKTLAWLSEQVSISRDKRGCLAQFVLHFGFHNALTITNKTKPTGKHGSKIRIVIPERLIVVKMHSTKRFLEKARCLRSESSKKWTCAPLWNLFASYYSLIFIRFPHYTFHPILESKGKLTYSLWATAHG